MAPASKGLDPEETSEGVGDLCESILHPSKILLAKILVDVFP